MTVRIRLKRFGKKKVPVYRVVVVDQRKPRDGKTIETIGKYNPKEDPIVFDIKKDRVEHWISVGAQLSETVSRLLQDASGGPKRTKQSSNQGIAKKDRKKENSSES